MKLILVECYNGKLVGINGDNITMILPSPEHATETLIYFNTTDDDCIRVKGTVEQVVDVLNK